MASPAPTPRRTFSSGASMNSSAIQADVVVQQLHSSLKSGLSSEEAAKRLEQYGRNELPEVPPTSTWTLFLNQFDDTLVKILLAAAGVSFLMAVLEGELHGFIEPFVILLILMANAAVGVWQENRAESAIDALKTFVPKTASVLRDGKLRSIEAEILVPGDICEIAVGTRIPADMRICQLLSTTMRVDQAILTGESHEVVKHSDQASEYERFPLNIAFSGTAVVYGKARCLVVKTGSDTEIGAIERDVREQEDTETPLQKKLDEFGETLSKGIGYVCLIVFAIHVIRWFFFQRASNTEGYWVTYIQPLVHCLKVAVALAVAAIPEGLPAVVTTCLALGTRRMARHNALVRELPAVETLGRCTVICSDKTGTLTMNMMSVVEVFTLTEKKGLKKYTLENTQYSVVDDAVFVNGLAVSRPTDDDKALEVLTHVASLCNDASLSKNPTTGDVEKIGEATEAALKTMVEKLSTTDAPDIHHVEKDIGSQWTKNMCLEFTRERKSMSVHCTAANGRTHQLLVKGAPESVLERCDQALTAEGRTVSLTKERRATILAEVRAMGSNETALRCLGFAFTPTTAPNKFRADDPSKFAALESGMTFCGVVGMMDPPRTEVREAIHHCQTAGIRVIVITGDNKDTAQAIARKIGIFEDGEDADSMSFTGEEFTQMSPEQRRASVMKARLFARTDPSHKMALVTLLQQANLVCAMTGDGVNDAPALKKADIGIAMGTGTEVAKSASKMVLADDNFATVVNAVGEGRAIYNNTKQFIRYLISSNIGEVVCILATGLCGIPDALEPVQLLWVNLVTDGLPATALGFNPPDPDIMEQPPRALDEPIVNRWLFVRYMVVGTYVGLATVAGFFWWFLANGFTMSELIDYHHCHNVSAEKCAILHNPAIARGIALSILVVVEMCNSLNALSENQSIISMRPTANPWLLLAIASSMLLHFLIMYVPALADIFEIHPLGVDPAVVKAAHPWSFVVPTSFVEWKAVLVFSFPVIFVDEFMKILARRRAAHYEPKLKAE